MQALSPDCWLSLRIRKGGLLQALTWGAVLRTLSLLGCVTFRPLAGTPAQGRPWWEGALRRAARPSRDHRPGQLYWTSLRPPALVRPLSL